MKMKATACKDHAESTFDTAGPDSGGAKQGGIEFSERDVLKTDPSRRLA